MASIDAPQVGRAPPTVQFCFVGGMEVVAGNDHWKFVTRGGAFTPEQLAWFGRSGVGARVIGLAPTHGYPWWNELRAIEGGAAPGTP